MLTVLKASPGLDQTSLARAMGFDKVTVLRVLRGLEARGLVSRTTAPKGRRSVSVLLTPSGQDLLQSAQKPAEQAYARLMAPLSEPEQAQFIQLLTRLTTELETDARAPWVPL